MLLWLTWILLALALWFVIVDYALSVGRPAKAQLPWLDAARRESWDLGLPFPEADGTLSQPPVVTPPELQPRPTGQQVAAVLHGRRIAAEPKAFLIKEAVATGLSHREAERMSRAALIKYVRAFDDGEVVAAAHWNAAIRDSVREVATSQQAPPPTFGESD
jgi:hypothetical protein